MYKYSLYCFLAAGLVACGKSDQPPAGPPAVPVNVTRVQKQHAVYYDTYPATVVALNEVELRAEVGGYITEIAFKEGQQVRKGQKLYEIDRTKYAAAYQQAKANLEVAKANEAKAQKDADRYTKLSEQDAIAQQRVDYAQTDLQNARSQVAAAEAAVARASTDLRYSTITAPFDGTVGISQVRLGALVTAGQTLLNTISTQNPIAVDVEIDEKQLSRFLDYEQADATPDSLFTITLPNQKVYPYPGKISLIDRAIDPQTGTTTVRLVFPNDENRLRPGMSCLLRVRNDGGGERIVIPSKAITEQMSEYFVFTVDSSRAKQVRVELGPDLNGQMVINKGLEVGQQIVVDGVQKLRNGTPVQLESPATASQNAGGTPAAAGAAAN
ncbi:efflux RND transporter periplasmic adaptor subunit [Catalinimonas alkaloidigena]|nr:efflux RND transporter periplasmic adaptor subunit [Catalinimonas alkaloidigena]